MSKYFQEYNKICGYCNKPFKSKSKSAIFCSNGCRQMNHKIKHNIPIPNYALANISKRIPTKTEIELTNKIQILHRIQKEIDDLNNSKKSILNDELEPLNKLFKAADHMPSSSYKYSEHNPFQGVRMILKNTMNTWYEKNYSITTYRMFLDIYGKQKKLQNINIKEHCKESILSEINTSISNIKTEFNKKFEEKLLSLVQEAEDTKYAINELNKGYSIEELQKNKDIISTDDLLKKEYEIYEFDEDFEKVLGHPEKNSYIMIHGSAGSGKSTFSVRFASYFNKFGNTCYFSLEEGSSLAFQNKVKRNQINGGFDISLERNPNKIQKMTETYDLCIIDSVNNASFSPVDVHNIIKHRANTKTLFILIFQDTKNSVYKGDSSYAHNADIVLVATNGLISVEKNRFKLDKVKDQTYKVYEEISTPIFTINPI